MISGLESYLQAMSSQKSQVVAPKSSGSSSSGELRDTAMSPYSLSPTQGDHLSHCGADDASSSSLSNTDSDSLRSLGRGAAGKTSMSNNNNEPELRNNQEKLTTRNSSKSPILIKYNYYDYNGARQEQTNHDMNYNQQQQQSGKQIQRQLSPTFKQHLDEIVSQQLSQQQVVAKTTLSPEPEPPQHQIMHFARRYKLSSYEQRCLRCNKTVYQMDKVGPLKDFTFYHQNCFKCRECGTKLTLKTYFNNQQSSGDQEVYCHRHCPKTGPGRLDNQSVGIRAALNAPKVFELAPVGYESQNLQHQHQQQHSPTERLSPSSRHNPNVDARALYIQHAVQQTRLQNIYKQPQQQQQQVAVASAETPRVDTRISQFISGRLEFLEPKQKLLEMRHREEEDALFKAFEAKWRHEESSISEQIREEWQVELNKLLDKYKRQLSSISSSTSSNVKPASGHQAMRSPAQIMQKSQTPQVAAAHHQKVHKPEPKVQQVESIMQQQQQPNKQQMIELERMNLEKTMTIKLDRKKETLKRKLKEFERQATAELVEKQSREMLALISMKLDEYKEEQKRKIGYDLEQFEAIDSLADQLSAGAKLSAIQSVEAATSASAGLQQQQQQQQLTQPAHKRSTTSGQVRPKSAALALEIPAPKAPQVSKMELYNSEEPDEVFRDIDQVAINVAREDQQSFTDLVHHLTRHCITDIEKVRAIFRWITVKNLNTMQFDSSVKADTPLGLLRGIKNGSESYHVLFKRLCSYAGLHCVVIKGYSKSAGYQPGVRFEGNRFRNSWNAVYVAGAWRFVQCNWGARHLVSVAVMQDKNQPINGNHKQQVAAGHQDPHKRKVSPPAHAVPSALLAANNEGGRSQQHLRLASPNHGRRGLVGQPPLAAQFEAAPQDMPPTQNNHQGRQKQLLHNARQAGSPTATSAAMSSPNLSAASNGHSSPHHHHHHKSSGGAAGSPQGFSLSSSSSSGQVGGGRQPATSANHSQQQLRSSSSASSDSLRYEYDDHYFLTDPDEFIYEFYPLSPEWQLIKTRPITLPEFEQLPFVRSLFFKYGLYFPQHDIRSVLYTDTSGATTIKIGMPTHMIPSLIFHYNLKYYDSDSEHYEGVSLKRFVMQSVECGNGDSANGQALLSNIVSFRVHLPENGAYILDIFANSTTPTQYITGEPMKFKSVCKFKIIAKNLKTVMIPLPDCASGEFGPMKATRLFGIIPITHESGLIVVQNDKRFLEIQFRMTRPLLDFMASLHKNGYDERQLSKSIKIFIEGDIVYVTVKFFEDGQYGLDIYTRDIVTNSIQHNSGNNKMERSPINSSLDSNPTKITKQTTSQLSPSSSSQEPKKQLLTHCCKYLINVRASHNPQ